MSTKLLVTLVALLGAALFLAACATSSTSSGGMAGTDHNAHESNSGAAGTADESTEPSSDETAAHGGDEASGMDHGSGMADEMVAELEPLSGEAFEIAFMDAMIPHHLSAIEMAQIALERTQRPELKAAAEAIITEQEREIAEMTGWLQAWYGKEPSGMDHGMAMEAEIEELRTVAAEEFDVAFLRAMIPHHEGAIKMAELVPGRTERPELLALSEAITAAQRTENEQFAEWMEAWSAE